MITVQLPAECFERVHFLWVWVVQAVSCLSMARGAALSILRRTLCGPRYPSWPQGHQVQSGLPTSLQPCRAYHEWRGYKKAYDQSSENAKKRSRDTAFYTTAVVLGMFGMGYASVPLYRMFCQATGYGGTVQIGKTVEEKLKERESQPKPDLESKAKARELRVWFSGDVAEGMPWRFTPTQEFVKIRPGESTLVFYTVENMTDQAVTGVSTYMVVPEKVAYYFNKIQCFCFEEQRLQPREVVDMPVFFYIDPEFVEDWNCRNITDITLSYTFFKVEDEDADLTKGVSIHRPLQPGSHPIPAA